MPQMENVLSINTENIFDMFHFYFSKMAMFCIYQSVLIKHLQCCDINSELSDSYITMWGFTMVLGFFYVPSQISMKCCQ